MQCSLSQKRNIAILLFLVPFLMGVGVDLYVPALPTIMYYFAVHARLVQLTIGLYMLGYALGQFFLGILSDSVGRKKVLLISCVFYVLVSFSSVIAPNIYLLIIYRFLQGVGIAGVGVVSRAIATDCFHGLDLTKVLTCFSISWAIGPIVGPFIGAYLQHYFKWQADFYFFGIFGCIIFIFVWVFIPETHSELVPLQPVKIANIVKSVLSHPVFLFGATVASLAYATLIVFNIIGPFLIQVVLHYSVVDYGHIALLLGVGYFIGNLCNRLFIQYIAPMKVTLLAIISALLISIITSLLGIMIKTNIFIILVPVFLLFFLCALILPNMVARCVGLFPKLGGTANAIVGSVTAGGVFLISMFATALESHSQMPMTLTYVVIFCICLVAFLISRKLSKRII